MTDADDGGDETFLSRLGETLLVAYASGQTVAGEWDLPSSNRMIPDLHVSVERGDDRADDARGDDGRGAAVPVGPVEAPDFERTLERFLLTEYARGERIDGVWNVWFPRPGFPEWTVRIDVGEPAGETDEDHVFSPTSD